MPNLVGRLILDPISQSVGKITKMLGPEESLYTRVLVRIIEAEKTSHHKVDDFVPWRVRL